MSASPDLPRSLPTNLDLMCVASDDVGQRPHGLLGIQDKARQTGEREGGGVRGGEGGRG